MVSLATIFSYEVGDGISMNLETTCNRFDGAKISLLRIRKRMERDVYIYRKEILTWAGELFDTK